MQIQNKKLSGYDHNKQYFWSPAVQWTKNNDGLMVDAFNYTGTAAEVFPEFYYKAQKGATPAQLMQEFSAVNSAQMEGFIQDLIQKRVLVSSILMPQEIFAPQTKIFKSEYSEETFFDPEQLDKFKKKQLNRTLYANETKKIEMKQKEEYPAIISGRQSYRLFDSSRKINMDAFSQLMSVFRQLRDDDGIRYYYASAGGLYPIDIYVYVKDNRLEGLQGGLYYYSPFDNDLTLASNSCVITDEAHLFTNKDIYRSSAFSIFFIYNAEVTMPKYGGMAYFYACIDTGIMVGVLTSAAELNNIGLCSIGNMNFKRIEKYFKLNENQVLIHTVEGGWKTTGSDREQRANSIENL